mmetsp:Transcript_39463/g.84101  ORF Transcript_39463/g.84101 Transcript_39463/m.84101 type:complete len:245 (+) Transcript_39463:456-1190(+)
MRVIGQEHEHSGLLLHAPKLTTTIASHPTLAILRDVHLSCVIAALDIRDGDRSTTLGQEPIDVLFDACPLRFGPCHEGDMADVLQNASRGLLELLASRAVLAERVAQLVILENEAVCVEALVARRLFSKAPGESARTLRLDPTHDLDLRSATAPLRTKDGEHLAVSVPASLGLSPRRILLVHEKHEHAPLFLHRAQRSPPRARDVADAVRRNVDDSAIVTVLPTIYIDRALQLLEEPLHVILGA